MLVDQPDLRMEGVVIVCFQLCCVYFTKLGFWRLHEHRSWRRWGSEHQEGIKDTSRYAFVLLPFRSMRCCFLWLVMDRIMVFASSFLHFFFFFFSCTFLTHYWFICLKYFAVSLVSNNEKKRNCWQIDPIPGRILLKGDNVTLVMTMPQ